MAGKTKKRHILAELDERLFLESKEICNHLKCLGVESLSPSNAWRVCKECTKNMMHTFLEGSILEAAIIMTK